MNLAIFHYHLNRGGVMQVITNHLRALDAALGQHDRWRVALLYGGRREGWPEDLPDELRALEITHCVVPDLDYEESGRARPEALAQQLRAALAKIGFTAETTMVHAHNHALGKNPSVPGALAALAREGYPLLLQTHDFAEDFRPDMYRRLHDALAADDAASLEAQLYPQGPRIHYALLNARDYGILGRFGVEPQRLHLLPNPVSEQTRLSRDASVRTRMAERLGVATDRPFFLYPVRGIARKNVGEMLLWSAMARDRAYFGITLPPLNPLEKPMYAGWKELATELRLPCRFELGAPGGFSFSENLSAADQILTTSVAEGFGMVFLESWLTGRMLVGRNLPEITSDFAEHGVNFPSLYERLRVPVDWIGHETFCASIASGYERVLRTYGRPVPAAEVLRGQCETLVEDGQVDFGTLDVELQHGVIRRAVESDACRERLLDLNQPIAAALAAPPADAEETIERNGQAVRQHYALAASGGRLAGLYRQVDASRGATALDSPPSGERILDMFLELPRFRPIRCQ